MGKKYVISRAFYESYGLHSGIVGHKIFDTMELAWKYLLVHILDDFKTEDEYGDERIMSLEEIKKHSEICKIDEEEHTIEIHYQGNIHAFSIDYITDDFTL